MKNGPKRPDSKKMLPQLNSQTALKLKEKNASTRIYFAITVSH
jgi:hypothetical protein